MEDNYKNKWLGFTIALIGVVLGIGANVLIFFTQYRAMIDAQLAVYGLTRTNWKVITYILPIFASMGTVAGFLYLIGMAGFRWEQKNAYKITMVANVIALLFSFWPMIPALDTGTVPYYVIIFLPNTLIYLLLNFLVGKKHWGRVLLGLITGMTMVMCYINGTASLNIFWMRGELFYIIANPIHYTAMVCFGIITVAILLKPKNWIRILAMVIGIIEIGIGGYMGITTTIQKGEFSMYLGAPAMSILIIIVVAIPFLWNKIVKPDHQ